MHESARPAPVPKGELPVRRGVRSQMVRFAKTDDSAVVVTARPAALPPRRRNPPCDQESLPSSNALSAGEG